MQIELVNVRDICRLQLTLLRLRRWERPRLSWRYNISLVDVQAGIEIAALSKVSTFGSTCALHVHAGYFDAQWVAVLVLTSMITYIQAQQRSAASSGGGGASC